MRETYHMHLFNPSTAQSMLHLCKDNNIEICGYISEDGGGSVYTIPNIAKDPINYFEVNKFFVSKLCMSARDEDLLFWHSHPKSRPTPSKEDIDFMERTQRPHVIIGLKPFPIAVLYGWEGKRIVQIEKVIYDCQRIQTNTD